MAQIVKLRRSGISGQKPTNANLQLGEIALNTTDGKLFFAKSGSLGPTIEEVISTNTVNTGSINLIGDITGSIFSGSFKGDGNGLYNIPISGVTNLSTISSSIDNRLDILELYSGSYTGSFSGSFSGTTYVDYIDFNTGSNAPIQSGRLRWNSDEGTLSFGANETGVESFIGQQLDYPLVFNDDTVNLVRGTLVMVNPLDVSQGDKLNIIRAISDGTYPSKLIVGVLKENAAVGETGIAQWFGKLKNISIPTLETNNIKFSGDTWFEGSILYADPNRLGGLTSIEPTAPNLKVTIAVVTRLAGNNVTLLIRPQLNENIEELNNVKSSNVVLGDLLMKSGSVWINTKQLDGSYGLTGSLVITGSQTIKGQQTISGSVYITEDLIVLGSSSLQNITASSVDIGTNTINLNTFFPSVRYGGINVFDSGSSGVSASLLWDSQTDNWIFVHEPVGGPVDSSYFLYGPLSQEGVGSEDTLTGNYLTKVENNGHGHHLTTSSLFDDGTKVSIKNNTEITGSLIVTGGINGTLDYSFVTNTPTIVSSSSQIDHNATTNYVANQHIDHTTVSISPGNGLSGGGTIAATRTLTLDTGSSHFTNGVKTKMNSDGVISGSGQIVLTSVNGYAAFSSSIATTNLTQDGRLTSLESTTGSLNTFTSSAVLTSQTGSMTVLSSSFATTASFALSAGFLNAPIGTYNTLVVTTPSTTWSFQHNTGQQYPIFQVFNENGYVIIPSQIRTIDNDNAEIIFSSPQSGRVVASLGGGNGTTKEFTNSDLWVVNHDLGTDYPDVTVWDSNRNIIFPNQIESVNSNQIKIYFSSLVSGHVSISRGGHILSGGAVEASWDEVNNKPSGIVSGSSQIIYSGLTGVPSGIVSGSSQILNGSGIVSGSSQISFNGITDKPALVSGSSQISYPSLSNIPSGLVSGSEQVKSLLPTGTVSGSSQVLAGTTIHSGSFFNGITVVSGSSQISHDSTTGYVVNQHIDHTTVSISPGSGLSGGGTIAATRTLTLDTGSVHFLDGVKKELNTEGVISGSGQVVLTSVNGYTAFSSSLATTNATQDGRLTSIETSTASLNTFTSSTNTFINNVNGGLEFTGSNVTVKGNFLVKGTTTSINSTTLDIGDNIISLNGSGAANGGLVVRDVTSPNTISGSLLWDTANDRWIAGPLGSEQIIVLNNTFTGYTSTTNTRLTSIETSTGSLNTFTGSINTTIKTRLSAEGVFSGSAQVSHDSTTGYVADRHIAHTTVSISPGNGLSGGGTIAATRTLTLDTGSVHFLDGVKKELNTDGVISGSSQVSFSGITGVPSGLVSGSSQIILSGTTGYSAVINQAVLTTSSPTFSGITVTGTTTTNGLVLGTQTSKATISYTTNVARTYTIPDAGADANFVMTAGAQTIAGVKTFSSQLINNIAIGTAPFAITSTTRVANLNVATAGTADTLTTARTIAISGGATGTATSFNGSANITIPVTALNANNLTAGTIPDSVISGNYNGITAIGMGDDFDSGPILTFSGITGGSGYVDGTYSGVTLTNSITGLTGSLATANITVSGGVVTSVVLVREGSRYKVNNSLTASNTLLGGTGSGFSVLVATVRRVSFNIFSSIDQRIRLMNSTTSVSADDELGSILFGSNDSTPGGRGDKVRIIATAEGTSGGGKLEIWTAANGAEPTLGFLFGGNNDFRLYNTAGTFYHTFSNSPTANRTITLPDGNTTLVAGTMVPTTGTGATGTWGISVSGNSATVTNGVYTTGDQTIAGTKTFSAQIVSTIATGTAPFSVTSTTRVTNLNVATAGTADNVSVGATSTNLNYPIVFTSGVAPGSKALFTDTANDITINPSTNSIAATTFSGALSGNATTATTLQTARTINGVSFNGSANITIADATKLPLSGGTVSGNILPSVNNTYNLGSPSLRWANIYTNDLHLSNMYKPEGNDIDGTNGDWTIQEGAENLYIINNKNGKKFKIDLTEIK
jgi:hypothetical protein